MRDGAKDARVSDEERAVAGERYGKYEDIEGIEHNTHVSYGENI